MISDLQKASVLKRISAFTFDFIIFCIIAVGLATLMSSVLNYDSHMDKLEGHYTRYEEKYGIDLDISDEDYSKLGDDQKKKYEDADAEFRKDPQVMKTFDMLLNLSLIILTVSILVAIILVEFVVPLIFKNGQTLGKKIFGIAVIRTDGVKATNFQIFVRAVLGRYTIETMIPVLIALLFVFGAMRAVGVIVIVGLLIAQIACLVATKTNSAIHDLIAVTVTVDMATQMIFDSEEQKLEYQKKLAAERAENSPY